MRTTLLLAIGLAVLAVGASLILLQPSGDGDAVLRRLAARRVLVARLSVDRGWSECPTAEAVEAGYCRSPQQIRSASSPRRLAALEAPGGDRRRRLALATLLLRREDEALDRVLSDLEAAAEAAPDDDDRLVDLSAARLTAGWRRGSATSFADALDAADRALEITPENARACINRAFALGELGLHDLAVQGWERCARLETDAGWRAEAEEHALVLGSSRAGPEVPREQAAAALRDALRSPNRQELDNWSREHPQLALETVIRELVPLWAETGELAEAAGRPGLAHLAEGVTRRTGDRQLSDLVRQLRAGLEQGREREISAGAHLFSRGLAAYGERQFHRAADLLTAGAEDLRAVPALAAVARAYGAVALSSSGRTAAAREELSALVGESTARSYRWPLGYARWTQGRMAIREGRLVAALGHYRQALQAFEANRAQELALSARILMAETYGELGQPEQALTVARQALDQAYRAGASDRLFFVLNLLASIADQLGRPRLACYAQTSALAHAAGEPPRSRANAHLWRAYLLSRIGRRDPARDDLRRAAELAAAVDDPTEKTILEAEIALARGVLEGEEDPEAAVTRLGRAARLFGRTGARSAQLVALEGRADLLRRTGRTEEAARDLAQALAAYAAAARELDGTGEAKAEPARLAYLRHYADVYQAMIDLQVEALDSPWPALLYAEQGRSPDALGQPPVADPEETVGRWARALPAEAAFISYGTAGDQAVAWVLTPAGRSFSRLGPAEETAALVDRLGRARDAEAWRDLSEELYRRLVAPLEEMVAQTPRLLVVPGPGFDRVPFAGLLDPRSGRYLAETHQLELLPGASALLHPRSSSRGLVGQGRALVVGDPRPTNADLLDLPDLVFAEDEARAAATDLGPGVVLLLGPEATPRRFRQEAPEAQVIHVAAHALSLGRGGRSAALVLATGEGDREGLLTATEILALPLAGTRLVVLSACASAGGPAVSWQSGLTLGRSFLSAGAQRVIATLNRVDDQESARLFQGFYRRLAAGEEAATGLRQAQIDVLRWRRETARQDPPSWPYVVILEAGPSHGGERRTDDVL